MRRSHFMEVLILHKPLEESSQRYSSTCGAQIVPGTDKDLEDLLPNVRAYTPTAQPIAWNLGGRHTLFRSRVDHAAG